MIKSVMMTLNDAASDGLPGLFLLQFVFLSTGEYDCSVPAVNPMKAFFTR